MKILFLHGCEDLDRGAKQAFLTSHGHTVLTPALDKDDFDTAVLTAQAEYQKHQPDVVVGHSRGAAVAMNILSGETPLVLLCPAWKTWGGSNLVKQNSVILHSPMDDVVPLKDSEVLVANSKLPSACLVTIGSDHSLADPKSLLVMLNSCEQHAFYSMIRSEIAPWIEKATIPFFFLQKDPLTNSYEQGTVGKDRTGVMVKRGNDHFILTASHVMRDIIDRKIFLFVSWDDEEKAPIPLTTDEIALSDESSLDIAIIRLTSETTEKLLRRHVPLSADHISTACRASDGIFLIVGYPRAFTEFIEQKWNDPEPHAIKTDSLIFICMRKYEDWKHEALKYDPKMHIIVGMQKQAVSTLYESTLLPDHAGIEGISGCGIWLVADRKEKKSLSEFRLKDCRLVAIEHSYDKKAGLVAGTWIDLALAFLALKFPENAQGSSGELLKS